MQSSIQFAVSLKYVTANLLTCTQLLKQITQIAESFGVPVVLYIIVNVNTNNWSLIP